jgi:hypothetical protein
VLKGKIRLEIEISTHFEIVDGVFYFFFFD